jgi:hypothetical protein
VPQPLGQCTFAEAEGGGVEPPRLYARSASNGVPSPIGLPFQQLKTPAQRALRKNIESVQRESNPHFRLGKAVGYRYIMGTVHRGRIVKDSESTGWDSNPRFRVTKAESSPLDHQCKIRSELRVGPEGLEPSPTWLRARRAAANTSVPFAIDPGGVEPPSRGYQPRVLPLNHESSQPQVFRSGRSDSNRRAPVPETGGLTWLSHTLKAYR